MTFQARSDETAGFDTPFVTATVNPGPAPSLGTVETGFDELDETPAAVQQAAPTIDAEADAGTPEDPEDDLDARVAALLPDKSKTDWTAVSSFMGAVVTWPRTVQDPGWVNLHYSYPNREDPNILEKKGGWPKKDLKTFIGSVSYILRSPTRYKDVWYCTSLQSETKTSDQGKLRAHRLKANAMKLKAIWVDVDVDDDPKHYHTIPDALKAVLGFQVKVGLPAPSAIVTSGGGIHVYWISKDSLTPVEWMPCAQGLKNSLLANAIKCDASITTDAARILRVPGTLNYKYNPPKPVQLSRMPLVLYDFDTDLAILKSFAGPTATPASWGAKPAHFADEANLDAFKKGPAKEFDVLKALNEPGLDAGIDKFSDSLVDPRPIFAKQKGGCAFYRDAFKTGGRDHRNPLWTFAVLGTTFMENGNAIAHAISKGHPDYTEVDTQTLYDRKVAERVSRGGIGYPSCATFEGAGSKSCATCPLRTKGKSPLNIRPVVTATVTNASSPSGSTGPGPISANEITINYVPGNEVACRTALDNVVAADLSTFASGDILTILRVPDQEKPGLERWGGDLPGTTPALAADIIERAERLTWMAPSGGKAPSVGKSGGKASSGGKAPSEGKATSEGKDGEQRWKRCKPPRDFCTDYITQRRGRYAARLLVGIARVPFIRDDGTIRHEPGYDPETGIFVDRAPKLIVPNFPTLDDARAALQRVMKPYEYYVFEEPVNGPLQVLAANLTALQRPYMKTAPMFVVNGVQAGTGKGQLCRAIGRLALATTPPFMSWGHDDDEFKKRFDTMLLASPAMLVMDNCNGRLLRGDTLEMILSEGEATIRQFNKLEAITVRSRTFLMANGNNIQISGDMSRRGIKINILPRSASPESDVFPFTPEDYVIEHRDTLLSDYYTIMRAFRLAGMPLSGLPAVGSFSEWERKVRDLIFWLTGHDLSGDFKKNKLDDPEQQEDAALLSALRNYSHGLWFKAAEIDAALKRAIERRRPAMAGADHVADGPKTMAAMKKNNAANAEGLVKAMEDGKAAVDADVLREIKAQRELAARIRNETDLMEAAEQKFGAKQDYAKTLGNWARGIQKKYVDGLILHRQEDPHTKIHRIKVVLANTADE